VVNWIGMGGGNKVGDNLKHLLVPTTMLFNKTEKDNTTVLNPDAQTFVNPAGNKTKTATKTILSRSGDTFGNTSFK
jgi:hypothetical protein